MPFQEKQIAQIRPPGISAVSAYSPAVGVTGIVKSVTIANVHTASIKVSVFIDDDGSTFDLGTALYNEVQIGQNQSFEREVFWPMNNSAGNLGVQSSVADGATFTFHGAEVT